MKKGRRKPLLEELTNAPPTGRGFLTNPHHRDRQDDNCPTNDQKVGGWGGGEGGGRGVKGTTGIE